MDLNQLANQIIDHLNDAVIVVDRAGRCVAVNIATCQLTGYEEAELLQTPLNDLLIPWDVPNPAELIDRLPNLSNGSGAELNLFEIHRKDGTPRFTQGKTITINSHQVHIIQDITPYLAPPADETPTSLEKQPSENKPHLFKTIIESFQEAILICDLDDQVIYANPAYRTLFGQTPINCHDHHTPESVATYEEVIRPKLMHGESWEGEIEVIDASGRRFPLWKRADIITDLAGNTLYHFGIMHDITDRKEAEEALRRYAKEQAALYNIASTFTESFDNPKILFETVLDVTLPLLNATAGWVVVPPTGTKAEAKVAAWRNIPEIFLDNQGEVLQSLQTCSVCQTLLTGENSEPAPQLFDECPLQDTLILDKLDLYKHVGVPLTAGEYVEGILILAWREPQQPYGESDHNLLLTIGRQVGMALHNGRLYRAARQVDHLKMLNNLDQALAASLDPDRVAQVLLEHATNALEVPVGALFPLSQPLESSPLRGTRVYSVEQGWAEPIFPTQIKAEVESYLKQQIATNQGPVSIQQDTLIDILQNSEFTQQRGTETLLVPIRQKDKLAIVLALGGRRPNQPFNEDDRALAQAIVNRAGQAIHNAHLYKVSQARVEELALLNEIGFALASTLDYSKVLRDALVYIQAVFYADNLSLIQPDPRTREIRYIQTLVGNKLIEILVRQPPSEGIAGWVLKHRQPALIEDVQNDPRWSQKVDQHIEEQTCTMMAVPLLTPTNIIGVIELVSSKPGEYTIDKLQTLRAIAAILAVALENARLYEELKTVLHEREQVQVQLIHSEKIAALGRLVASISHEINNPLQAVQGCLSLTKEEFNGLQRPDKIREYLNVVEEEVSRISNIVRRTRDFYRPSQGGIQPTDVHAVLNNVLTLTNKQLQHSHITIECNWAENPPKIEANPDHLKQVFLNLLLNAIDAMPDGGTLRIDTLVDQIKIRDKQKLQTVSKQPAIHVTFSDTGTGMSIEVLSHLFEPFFTTKPHGSGLGLAISYGIIEAHHGQIMVTSQLEKGTTFTIQLPVKQP